MPLRGVGDQENELIASKPTSLLCKEGEVEEGQSNNSIHLSIVPVTLGESRERKPRWFLRRFKRLKGNSFSWGELMSNGG